MNNKTNFSANKMIQKDYIYSNAKLHYTVVSGNPDTPLVLIHGQCMCGLDYEKVIKKLQKKYTLYLIDCFGHGESEKAPELYRCTIIGDAIAELIRNEIGKPCIVSGHDIHYEKPRHFFKAMKMLEKMISKEKINDSQ